MAELDLISRLQGALTAIVTPFADDGSVDLDALGRIVDGQLEHGIDGLVPCGTTGETPCLTAAEQEKVVRFVGDRVKCRVPVIAGTGTFSTAASIENTKRAQDWGIDAALVVCPYYNKPTQRGLIAHYTALHDCADIPIFIYNIPGRSVIDMTPETMGELAKLPRIVGVKDATGDMARVCDTRFTCGTDFIQMCAEDAVAHGFNAVGGVGCISVTANVAPKLLSQMQEACLAGDYATALEIQTKLMPLHKAIFTEPGLVGVKYAMSRLGLCSDEVRLPLVGLSDDTKALVDAGLEHAGLM